MPDATDTFDAGFAFAEQLTELTHRSGPQSLTHSEREVLAQHLISTAVSWVKARNMANSLAKATGQ